MLRIEYFDKERFMRQLSASHGSVLLHLDNGKTCDLKQDATARSMLQMMDTAPKKGFDLTVTDPADVTGFLRYMLEAIGNSGLPCWVCSRPAASATTAVALESPTRPLV